MRAAVDANVLIAARLERDQHHERATVLTRAIDRAELPRTAVPGGVLEETLNYVHSRGSHPAAVATLDGLADSVGFEITATDSADLDRGRSVFRRYDALSLTDAVIVAWMRRVGVEYLYSFDDDFDAVDGVVRLETPHWPAS
ncbi:type II toxin-antitoxin system VapC family toxin [Halobaculum sp. MBLA0147]|uniref:type II toxin-antitoxin system VapC family toxin n=1 Tax=Halobaculum sp. MBLA0147 TaxID=3079934 RepID=UPI0035255676